MTLLFIGFPLLAQKFDRGNGERADFRVPVTVLKWIESGKPGEILPYLSEEHSVDTADLRKECEKAAASFPYVEGLLPVLFSVKEEGVTWYERTYFKRKGRKSVYLLQVYMTMVKEEDGMKIASIEFRYGEQVKERKEEMKKISEKVNKRNPPPGPPPPPPF